MKRYDRAFAAAARRIAKAGRKTVKDYAAGRIPDEPNFTAALVTRLQDEVDGLHEAGISWAARILSSRTEEPRFGADFLGILKLELPGYSVTKGFLAQAKRQEPGSRLGTADWTRLTQQCEAMLSHSAESFVFVYALNGVIAVPAISVLASAAPEDLHTLHPQALSQFYRDHFECWIGQRIVPAAPPPPWTVGDFPFNKGIEISGEARREQ